MRTASTSRLRSHRALGLYVGAVVLPTLALLYLGYVLAQQQWHNLQELTRNNERLSSEQVATETERRVFELAGECVRDPEWADAIAALHGSDRPDTDRRIRVALERIVKRHPVAAALFIAQGDTVRFPRLQRPLQLSLSSYLDGERISERPALLKLLQGAELAEAQGERLDEATAPYRQVLARAQSPPLRALALARLARVAQRARDVPEAARLYRRLSTEYPDEYDPFHKPYALVAALELRDLEQPTGGQQTGPPPDRESLQLDIARGRWEITPDVAAYFHDALRPDASTPDPARPLTPFESHFKTAEAFALVFAGHGALRADQVYPLPVEVMGTEHQFLYSQPLETARDGGPEIILALDVDLNWVKTRLMADVARELKVPVPVVTQTTSPGSFRDIFRSWRLGASSAAATAGRTDTSSSPWVFAGATILVLGVLVIGVVLLIRDVSRERQLNMFKADLVAGVSHELKTPLTIIRLYAETLGGSLALADEERREYSDIITRESDRLTTLIDRVLSFSRMEQRGRIYNLAPGELSATVKLAVGVFSASLHRRGFDVTFEPGESVPAVQFDADAVLEAVLNLLDNAAKYSGESRWIGIRLAQRENNDVVVEVEDRGPGIDPKDHDRIFQEYYRGDGSPGGHGLGLYLVRHIMAGHGGRVEVDSEPDRGSIFRLVFPPTQAIEP